MLYRVDTERERREGGREREREREGEREGKEGRERVIPLFTNKQYILSYEH